MIGSVDWEDYVLCCSGIVESLAKLPDNFVMKVEQLEEMLQQARSGLTLDDHWQDPRVRGVGRVDFAIAIALTMLIGIVAVFISIWLQRSVMDAWARFFDPPKLRFVMFSWGMGFVVQKQAPHGLLFFLFPACIHYLVSCACLAKFVEQRMSHAGYAVHPAWILMPVINLLLCLAGLILPADFDKTGVDCCSAVVFVGLIALSVLLW
ncbi:hypothetical protein OAH18_02010 [bacterium]|nr:hypothetical protein [bacterium]